MDKIVLAIAIFGCIIFDFYVVYSTDYYIDIMEWHPYPERIWAIIIVYIVLALVVNTLTFMMYRSMRK